MDIKTNAAGHLNVRALLRAFVIAAAFMILCTSCNYPGSDAGTTEAVQLTASSPTTASDAGATIMPVQKKVLLYAAQESEDWVMRELKEEIIELAEESGLVIESVNQISEEYLKGDVSLVFIFEDDPGIVNFASRFTEIQFIGVDIPNITPSSNISLIGENGLRKDQQAFVAGYLAAMVAEDWRAGVVSIGESEDTRAIEEGFLNGARYFCGLCRPAFPPFYEYPQSMHLDSSGQSWGSVVGAINESRLNVIYLAPVGVFEKSINEWTQINSAIIGDGPRPEIVPESQWMAAVQFTASDGLQSIWNDLLAGNGGFQIQWELQIVEVNRDLLSVGRERDALVLIEDLAAGFVDTGFELQDG
jgi:basic membrane lipoprotein Med (substrate-binding protein (PBP1-ABC) superfamily)